MQQASLGIEINHEGGRQRQKMAEGREQSPRQPGEVGISA